MAQDDDSFGLPDINFKPLDPKPQATPPPTPTPPKVVKKPEPTLGNRIQTPGMPAKSMAKKLDTEEKSNASIIVGILVPLLLLVGGYFGYRYLYKIPKEKAAQEAIVREKMEKEKKEKEEAARLAKLKEEEEARMAEAAKNEKPAIGTMETLAARTGRFYVVISSSIDDDLVLDLAQKLSPKGVSTKIIPPYGDKKYFRLTISDHETFALAQADADVAKAEYGSGVWVIKY